MLRLKGAMIRPVGVRLTGAEGVEDVTGRLVYGGWHEGSHAWQLPLEEAEQELFVMGRLHLSVERLPPNQGLVVTEPGVSLQDFSWGEEPCA